MAKSDSKSLRKYTYFNALLAGIICGAVAFGINYMILKEKLNHDFEALFAPVAVGVLLCILNFKPLSKLSIFLLPPIFGVLGFAPVLGIFALSYLGLDSSSLNETVAVVAQTLPFLLVASFVHKWYAGLAGKNSFISYALFSIVTVIVGFLLFKDNFSFELVMSAYLGVIAFLLSRLHVGTILG